MDIKQRLKGKLALLGYFPPELASVELPVDLPAASGSLNESQVAGDPPPVETLSLEEASRQVLVGGRLVKKKVRKHSAAERNAWKRAARKPSAKAARKKLAKKSATKRKARIRARLSESLNAQSQQPQAAAVESSEVVTSESVLVGFSELAANASLLAQSFDIFAEAYTSPELRATARRFSELSEQSKSVVEGLLAAPASFDPAAVAPRFLALHDLLVDGLTLNSILAQQSASEAEAAPGK